MREMTDGVVVLRSPRHDDVADLVAGRDEESRRWLGEPSPTPNPTACVIYDEAVVGWVDFDLGREWLSASEVNVGYALFAPFRGRGLASRAVQLLLHHLSRDGTYENATVLIDRANARSLALARRLNFESRGSVNNSVLLARPVPPRTYSDGVVTIRPLCADDLERDLEAKDDEQITWLWEPGERELWEAMSSHDQRRRALARLEHVGEDFGAGAKWCFAVDTIEESYVAYVDCDLANPHVPRGEANVAYSAHPTFRGRGYVSRAVRLVLEFLRENTGAREAHVLVDQQNEPSLRVARSLSVRETHPWINAHHVAMTRHVIDLRAT